MNHAAIGKIQKNQYNLGSIFFLMLVCLVFLVLGNIVLHAEIFPITNEASQYLLRHFSFEFQDGSSLADFLWAVIIASRGDILCVLLIAISHLVKMQKLFITAIFAYRSFVFGFCGAYIISTINVIGSFWCGCVAWTLFFVYHISLFAVLICFGSATIGKNTRPPRLGERIGYVITVCGEIALVIFLNVVYYFLISKI